MARIGRWSTLVLLMLVALLAVSCGGKATQPEDQPDKMSGPEMAEGDLTEAPPDAPGMEGVPAEGEPGAMEPEPMELEPMEPEPMEPEPAEMVEDLPAVPPEDARLEELRREKTIEQQAREMVARRAVENARTLFEQSKLEEALGHAQKALELDPANEEARTLMYEILRSLGRRPGEFASLQDQIRDARVVKVKEVEAKAEAEYARGKDAYLTEDYDAAVRAFENVLSIMNYSPYPADWSDLRAETEDYLAQAKEKQALRAEAKRREEARKAFDQARLEEMRRLQEQQGRIADMLDAAYEHFDNGEYLEATALAEKVLVLEPGNTFARNIKKASARGQHDQTSDATMKEEKIRYRAWANEVLETRIPYTGVLRFPDQKYWDDISRRRARHGGAAMGTDASPEEVALANRLEEETIGFEFNETPFPTVIDFIHKVRGINLVIDERIKDEVESVPVTLKVQGLPVKNVLELLLAYGGELTYDLRDNIVFITKPEFARGEVVLRVHPVGDLTMKLTMFIAPSLILKPAGGEFNEDQPQFGGTREGESTFTGPDELVDLIRTNVGDPESWDEEGVSITAYGPNLVVTHSPEVQNQVSAFLNDLRRFTGLEVTIETRFLTVTQAFLQEVGVDIRGLGGEKGPLALLDDVTSGLEDNASAALDNLGPGLPSGAGSNPSSGAFFNDGRHGDVRGRTEQIFDNALGNILSSLGGATLQYTYLDDVSLQVILRLVKKNMNARVMNAPSITVFNTQRANITLVNQLSFIQDFDVEVAQTAFIADPIVGVVQDGLTLDVRPTVSNDRRFVTLELQPTVATLLRPIPTFTTSLGAFTTPVTIQLPEISIEKSQTTVKVPDGGTVVIGGLKNISVVDRRSATPWLSKIPLLGFFFKREGNSEETRHLMIIITAQITDMKAEEERFRR